MANTYHNDTNNQEQHADFSMELSLAIRALYSAANAAPGPAFTKILTRAASEIEQAKLSYGVRSKLANSTARMVRNAEDRAA